MITRYKYRNVEWIDLESPTYEEVSGVASELKLNQLLAQELLTPTLKSRVDLYRDYLYLVLHFPAIRHSHLKNSHVQEIDFIVGKDFIVTTHYDTIDPLHEFSKIFEVNSILDRGDIGDNGGYIFYHMLKHIYKGMEHELDGIESRLITIQENIFSGKEREMVMEISKVNRDILNIKAALRPHQQVLDSLEVAAIRIFGKDFEYPMRSLKNENFKVTEGVLTCHDHANELRETNSNIVSTNENQTMKQLSAIAFIGLPLGLFIALLQIDTVSRPLVGHENDFWIILFLMITIASLLYTYAKSRKWL